MRMLLPVLAVLRPLVLRVLTTVVPGTRYLVQSTLKYSYRVAYSEYEVPRIKSARDVHRFDSVRSIHQIQQYCSFSAETKRMIQPKVGVGVNYLARDTLENTVSTYTCHKSLVQYCS